MHSPPSLNCKDSFQEKLIELCAETKKLNMPSDERVFDAAEDVGDVDER